MNTAIIRSRRRRTGTAAAAYSHALALTGDPVVAADIAATALRRGAHSRSAVLAHARHLTASRATSTSDPDSLASRDLRSLALQLSATRPVEERSLVDLQLRYGLDHGSFARALGVSAARSRARSSSIATTWGETLDPAMMASLGPGSCDGLSALLVETGVRAPSEPTRVDALAATGTDTTVTAASPADVLSPTVSSLVSVAPAVLTHTKTCDVCAQRLKLMTPVRSLVGQLAPEEVPQSVQDAARSARRLLPTPLPPSIDANRIDPRRLRTIALTVLVAFVILGAGFGVFNLVTSSSESQSQRVAKLVESAPVSSLLATPSVITSGNSTAALANNSAQPVLWRAETSAPWLTVEPISGRLAPNQNVSLVVKASKSGAATINITGSDGAKQTIRFEKP